MDWKKCQSAAMWTLVGVVAAAVLLAVVQLWSVWFADELFFKLLFTLGGVGVLALVLLLCAEWQSERKMRDDGYLD